MFCFDKVSEEQETLKTTEKNLGVLQTAFDIYKGRVDNLEVSRTNFDDHLNRLSSLEGQVKPLAQSVTNLNKDSDLLKAFGGVSELTSISAKLNVTKAMAETSKENIDSILGALVREEEIKKMIHDETSNGESSASSSTDPMSSNLMTDVARREARSALVIPWCQSLAILLFTISTHTNDSTVARVLSLLAVIADDSWELVPEMIRQKAKATIDAIKAFDRQKDLKPGQFSALLEDLQIMLGFSKSGDLVQNLGTSGEIDLDCAVTPTWVNYLRAPKVFSNINIAILTCNILAKTEENK